MRMFKRMNMFVRMRVISRTRWPLLLPVYPHIHLGSSNPAAIHARNLEPRPEIERCHSFFKHRRRHARIDQDAEKHVAAHAGKTLKIDNAHGIQLLALKSLAVSEKKSQVESVLLVSADDQRLETDD